MLDHIDGAALNRRAGQFDGLRATRSIVGKRDRARECPRLRRGKVHRDGTRLARAQFGRRTIVRLSEIAGSACHDAGEGNRVHARRGILYRDCRSRGRVHDDTAKRHTRGRETQRRRLSSSLRQN